SSTRFSRPIRRERARSLQAFPRQKTSLAPLRAGFRHLIFPSRPEAVITVRTDTASQRRPFRLQASTDRTAVILDSHPLCVDAVEGVLDRRGTRTAAKVTQPTDALAAVEEHRPAVLVAEVGSAGNGLSNLPWIKRIRESFPALRVIAVSAFDNEYSVDAAFGAGAAAYVVKTAHPDDLATAIRHAFAAPLYLADTTI